MISLLIYDIPADKLRSSVAETCLDYGLERIQFSAFLGELNHSRQEEILQKIKRKIGQKQANVQLFPDIMYASLFSLWLTFMCNAIMINV